MYKNSQFTCNLIKHFVNIQDIKLWCLNAHNLMTCNDYTHGSLHVIVLCKLSNSVAASNRYGQVDYM